MPSSTEHPDREPGTGARIGGGEAELLGSVLRILDDEREAVAHDLHDGPQQLVAAIRLMADAAAHALGKGDEQGAQDAVARLGQHADAASEELRRITGRLFSVALEQRGLPPALEALCSSIEEDFGVPASFRRKTGEWHPAPGRDAALYSLAREAAVGAARAGAHAIEVALTEEEGALTLTIEASHGRLSDLPYADTRTELMRTRAVIAGASLELTGGEDGERVVVRTPAAG